MQVAGSVCKICNNKILMQGDGTWCARCNTAFHLVCLEREHLVCATCRQRFDRPEDHFVYSKRCPECAQPNEPPAETCRSCGTSTCWDDRAKYEAFVDHMKDTSRVYLVKGIAQLGVGLVCVPLSLIRLYLILGVMILVPRGILTIRKSRVVGKFE